MKNLITEKQNWKVINTIIVNIILSIRWYLSTGLTFRLLLQRLTGQFGVGDLSGQLPESFLGKAGHQILEPALAIVSGPELHVMRLGRVRNDVPINHVSRKWYRPVVVQSVRQTLHRKVDLKNWTKMLK